jgi:2-succinyl-6-hydroxy-2,4-cyclohexadiene-1-carboxylate synthase
MIEIAVNGVDYAVRTGGAGTPLLLLHGFTGSGAHWEPLRAALADTARCLAPDLLGHGRTAAPADAARYAMTYAAADIVALLDALDVPTAHLLGYSMGGRLALYLALHYPGRWRSLILESASPGLAEANERAARRARDDALAQQIEAEGIASFVERWEQLPLWRTQSAAQKEGLRAQRLRNRPVGLANSLRGMGTGAQPSLWARLSEVVRPVLLLAGTQDVKFLEIARRMARALPDARLAPLPGGHALHLEQPVRYAAILREWLLHHEGAG